MFVIVYVDLLKNKKLEVKRMGQVGRYYIPRHVLTHATRIDWVSSIFCMTTNTRIYRIDGQYFYFAKENFIPRKLDIASRHSVAPDGIWLKRDIQSIMLSMTMFDLKGAVKGQI